MKTACSPFRHGSRFTTASLVATLGGLGFGGSALAQTTLYFDDFSGAGAALNGTTPDTTQAATTWSANSPFFDNGTINLADEGSAILPIDPVVNATYTLTMDVLNPGSEWIGLGFAQDPLTLAGGSTFDDRFSNQTDGIAWMLYRNNGAANAVQSFTGLATAGAADLDTTGLDFNATNELSVILDTTGTGGSFFADWRINGVSLRTETVNIPVDSLNFVGLTYNNTSDQPITFDNFRLTELVTGPAVNEWNVDADGNFSDAGNWTLGAPGAGSNPVLGSVITDNRTVTLTANASLNSLTFTNTGDGDYFVAPAAAQTLTLTGDAEINTAGRHWVRAAIAGSAGLNTTGAGELVLDAANTFSGGLTVDDTNLAVVNTAAIPAGNAVTIQNNGQVQLWGPDNAFFTDQGSAGYGTGTISTAVSIDATSELNVNDGADLTLSGAVSGAGVINANSGTITLGGNNTGFTGTVAANGSGVIRVNNNNALGAGGTAANGTTLGGNENTSQVELTGGRTVATEVLTLGARELSAIDAVHLTSTGNNAWNGNLLGATGGTNYNLESKSGTLTLGGTLSAPDTETRTYVFSGAGNFVVDSVTDAIVDADGNFSLPSALANVNVIKRGTGTLTINTQTDLNDDYHFGTTTIEAGTLAVNSDGPATNNGELRSLVTVNQGATFDVSDFTTYNVIPIAPFSTGLGGGGTVVGNTIGVFESATVSPGDSVGTLKINADVNLSYFDTGDTAVPDTGSLNFELGNDASINTVDNSENDLIRVNGNLNIATAAAGNQFVINVTPVEGAFDPNTNYTLIDANARSGVGTAANFVVNLVDSQGNPLVTRQTASVVFAGADVQLNVNGATANLLWTGNANNNWDVNATPNWNNGAQTFFDSDTVTFNATGGGGDINVAETVAPGPMTVTGASYAFSGGDINASSITVGSGGTASFDNTVGGNVVVQNNGTLGGAGTFRDTVGVQTGGTLRVGAAVMPQVVGQVFSLIDNFDTPGLGEYAFSKVLDQGTATNVSFSDAAGTIDVTSTGADGAEQVLLLRSDVTLNQGEELLIDAPTTFNDRDFGLAIGQTHADLGNGNTGDNRTSADFLFMAWRNFGQLNSRGFNGNAEVALQQAFDTVPDQLFIARTATDDVELGWYDGNTRNVLWTATPTTTDIFSNVGFYADVRADGNGFAGADNFGKLVPGGLVPVGETLTVEGDVVLGDDATLSLNIAGSGNNDLLNVLGDLSADGTLEVLLDATVSALEEGDTYDLLDFGSLSGAFDTLDLPSLTGNLSWDTSTLLLDGIISVIAASVEGDYNNSGQVEQADLDFVLQNWGDADVSDVTGWVNFPGGGGFDGQVNQNELDGVLLNWGNTTAPNFAGSAVPEPAALALLGGLGVVALRRRVA